MQILMGFKQSLGEQNWVYFTSQVSAFYMFSSFSQFHTYLTHFVFSTFVFLGRSLPVCVKFVN